MSILNLQRRLHEAGKLRIGTSVPAKSAKGTTFRRPVKLESFLFTSANTTALGRIAELFGGEVEPWEEAPGAPQSKVLTSATEIPVLVPPQHMSFSQAWEHWDAGRCVRRCDGEVMVTGEECQCDPDNRLCKPTTRLSLMLPQLAGSGLWRLDTRGYYAAAELGGAFGLAQILEQASGRSIIPGVLRLTQREVKREDPKSGKTVTFKFAVPALDFDLGPALPSLVANSNLSPLANGERPALPALSPVTPVPPQEPPSLADEIAAVDEPSPPPRRSNAAEPIKPTGHKPRPRGSAVGGNPEEAAQEPTVAQPKEGGGPPARLPTADPPSGTRPMTQAQNRALFRLLTHHGIDTDEMRHGYASATLKREVTSFKALSVTDAAFLIEDLQISPAEADAEAPF